MSPNQVEFTAPAADNGQLMPFQRTFQLCNHICKYAHSSHSQKYWTAYIGITTILIQMLYFFSPKHQTLKVSSLKKKEHENLNFVQSLQYLENLCKSEILVNPKPN